MTDDYNRSTTKEQRRSSLNEQEDKSRKFRWSSCFSFISSKFKKPKQPKLRLSQSLNEFEHKEQIDSNLVHEEEENEDLPEIPTTATSLPWKIPPPSSLSPPPRHRDSQIRKRQSTPPPTIDTNTTNTGRRPLVDPTLTPRVKPRSMKSKKQPSLLRLSLDVEPLQSPVDADTESVSTTGHSSSVSFTPTSQPFRSGTLGAYKNPKLSITSLEIPPMPHIPHDSSSCSTTRPNSQSTDNYVESPVEHTSSTDDEEKLTLKERRHRRSPLAMPDTDQLTLALKTVEVEERSSSTPIKRQPTQIYYDSSDEDDQQWRHQLLEQSITYSFTNKSRQEAMMSLEGKKAAPITLQPIVNVHDLDDHFDHTPSSSQSVVSDKAQYDAAVSRRSNGTTKKSTIVDKVEPLDSIIENEIATNVTTPTARLLFLSVTPQTPPHHQQNAPSLISAPSTPNSIDSSVPDQEDYLNQDIHHHLASLLQSI